jgi:uncharacterized membrane protein
MNRVLNHKFLHLLFFLAICLIPVHSAFATTVVMPTDTGMVIGSRAIISGRVLKTESALDAQTNRIYTYITIRVQEVFKGEIHERKIVLKQEGGQVAGRGSLIFGTPEFTLDEQVVLYLDTWADGAYRVHQMFLGKFNIVDDPNSGQQFAVRSEMGDRVVVLPNPQPEANSEITSRLELSAYKEMLRNTILANTEQSYAFEQKYYSNTPKLAQPREYQELVGKGKLEPQWTYIHSAHPRWFEPDTGQSVVFRINPAGAPNSQTINDVAAAMNAWSTVPGCALRVAIGANTDACGPDGTNNTIIFNNCDGRWSASGGNCQGVLALGGLSWLPSSTKIINGVSFAQGTAGFISFNPFAACNFGNSCNVQEITTHELGHALGLGHSADSSATMAAFAHFDGRCASLRPDDITGIVFIYPGIGGGGGTLSITTVSPLTGATVGVPYSQAILATGGTLPYTWSVSAGSLPAGVTLNAQTGLLAGTPTTTGTANFTLQVRDARQATAEKPFSITVGTAATQYNSQFISQTVPTTLQPGQNFQVNIKFTNTGTLPWVDGQTTNFYLVSQNPALNQTWGGNGVLLSNYPTQPGGQLDLNFSATAPLTPGTYNFQWQMYQNGGIGFFGPMTPNVVIQVGSGGGSGTNDAAFVSQTVPTTMTAGQTYSVGVTMRNSGTTTWNTSNYKLGSQNPQDNSTWGLNRVNLPSSVAPGGQVTFTFTVTAPSTAGTYNFQWKMLQDSTGYFGTASTNAAVSVTSPPTPTNDAAFVSQTVPSSMTAGQTYNVSVVMRNSGTTTWSTTAYKLGSQNPQDNSTWGLNRVNLPSSVAPNAQATFNFTVTAPSTPGTYNFQWRMTDSTSFFGATSTNIAVTVTGGGSSPVNNAEFISQNIPSTMVAGQRYSVTVAMRNSGTTTWDTPNGYKFGSQNPSDNTIWGTDRANIIYPVPPGQQVNFGYFVFAPAIAGTYNFQWRMLKGTEWFGTPTTNFTVTVVPSSTDGDNDAIPNSVEPSTGTNPNVKDNAIFTSNRLFVQQQYRDFLNREGESAGVQYWTDQMAFLDRGQVVERFFQSPEFQNGTAPITRLYFASFLRLPDYEGLQYWLDQFRSGRTLLSIAEEFVVSPEFKARYGSNVTNAQFINLLYLNVLERQPDARGLQSWIDNLNSGWTRGQVLLAFSESDEFRSTGYNKIFVVQLYLGMFRQIPPQAAYDDWVNRLKTGSTNYIQMINTFLNHADYHNRFLP